MNFMPNLQAQLRLVIVMLLMICSASCVHRTPLQPLPDEFQKVKKGDVVPFDGYCETDHWLQVVGDAKIDNSK